MSNANSMGKPRPKNLNLMTIRLPLPALVSILHRVSGLMLFLLLPVLLLGLQCSLDSAEHFERIGALAAHPLAKLLFLGGLWAFLHHFLAGLRHLAMDVHWGMELATARFTSKLVLAAGVLLTIATGVWIW